MTNGFSVNSPNARSGRVTFWSSVKATPPPSYGTWPRSSPLCARRSSDTAPDEKDLESYCRAHRISDILLIQGALSSETILNIAKQCEAQRLECKILPDLLEMRRGEIILDGFCGLPTFSIKSLSLHGADYVLKRSFDVICSLVIVAVLFLPLAGDQYFDPAGQPRSNPVHARPHGIFGAQLQALQI